jgi:tryptophan-rich sensory protein
MPAIPPDANTTRTLDNLRSGWPGLVVWLGVCFAAPALGSATGPGEWYLQLQKPSWNPPGWVFGPVWTVLYVTMAVAAWMVWRRGSLRTQRLPLGLFLGQLALNALWTPLFFGLRNPGLALVDIALLWLALLATIAAFWRTHRVAAALLLPYLAWVSFAAFLNFTIWQLNR